MVSIEQVEDGRELFWELIAGGLEAVSEEGVHLGVGGTEGIAGGQGTGVGKLVRTEAGRESTGEAGTDQITHVPAGPVPQLGAKSSWRWPSLSMASRVALRGGSSKMRKEGAAAGVILLEGAKRVWEDDHQKLS